MTDRDEKVREALEKAMNLANEMTGRAHLQGLLGTKEWDFVAGGSHLWAISNQARDALAALSHSAPDVPGAEEIEGEPAQDVEIEYWRSQCDSYAAFTMQATDLEPLIWRIDAERAEKNKALLAWRKRGAELDAARAELREVREAAGETLDTYAKSFRKMACEEYLVDALTFKGSSDNVKLAYGRAQGIEMARDRLAAARKGT